VTVAVLNGFLLVVLTAVWIQGDLRWVSALASGLILFVVQAFGIRARNTEDEQTQTFRAGVGAVILNADGQVLFCERRDCPGTWQMPQGGLKIGEAPLAAAKREVKEETGIAADELEDVAALEGPLAYELPPEHRSEKTGRGQVLYWFLFRFTGPDDRITLGDGKEFRAWRWTDTNEILSDVAPFKRPVYRDVATFLSERVDDTT